MPVTMNRRVLLLTPLVLCCGRAIAGEEIFRLGPISITHPWVPPAVTEVAALFLRIVNDGPTHERLIAASTPVAGAVIFRSHDGTPLEYYDLWPKRPLELGPGRRYIALRDLKGPLALDDAFPVALRFANAGEITVTAIVEAGPEADTTG
jgi:periplasmic copper chaperone A